MEIESYKKNTKDMLYLVACAINQEIPDIEKIQSFHLETLFEVCQKHALTACTAYALESAGIYDKQFSQGKEKAIRKNIILDAERTAVLKRLEQEKIWYMPLKGSILKDWYPRIGMRQMVDVDILYDGTYRRKIKEIMLDMGFTCNHYGKGKDDAYFKKPVCNFEMHHELFVISNPKNLYEYYKDFPSKLVKDENHQYGYHFNIEDFYLYMLSHEYKHWSNYGTGVRSLIDTAVFMKKFKNSLNWDYLNSELKKLEISEWELKNRTLSEKLLYQEPLSPEEEKYLEYYILSGTYGTLENKIEKNFHRIENGSKAKYLFRRIFPPMNEIEAYWNFFYRHKWLIPVLWIYRPINGILNKRKKISKEIHYLKEK